MPQLDSDYFLPIAVDPFPDESTRGLLLRLAKVNHLSHPRRILDLLRPSGPADLLEADLPRFCELSPIDPISLRGLALTSYLDHRGTRCYALAGERISKDYFLTHKHARVCPFCLLQFGYARRSWDFTLCTACPIHGTVLIDHCPDCGRHLNWLRRTIDECPCGFSLTSIVPSDATAFECWHAGLIWYSLGVGSGFATSSPLPPLMAGRLAMLSLDGLFKLTWYLGVYVAANGTQPAGKGRHLPTVAEASQILGACCEQLMAWPGSYLRTLERLASAPVWNLPGSWTRAWYGPLQEFLFREMDDAELGFVRSAFEVAVRRIWKERPANRRAIVISQQQELDFGA